MKRGLRVGLVVAVVGLGLATETREAFAAHVELINTGTPKNGDVEMTGWQGVIVRVVTDDGAPITRLDLGRAFGITAAPDAAPITEGGSAARPLIDTKWN